MKLITIFEQIELDELQGISFDARVWSQPIRDAIKISKNTPNPVINGKDYPKEYKTFPIDFIHFKIDENYRNGAEYKEHESGYDNNKQYHVYFIFGDIANDSAINHELKHAFEDFMRMSKGHQGLKSTKEGINLFSGDFPKFMLSQKDFQPISTLVHGLYMTSKIERSAFSDTVYDEPKFAGIIKYIRDLIEKCNAPRIMYYKEPGTLEKIWKEYKESFHIPITDKFNNYIDFIKWACDEINYKGNITLKKLQKVKYLGQMSQKKRGK